MDVEIRVKEKFRNQEYSLNLLELIKFNQQKIQITIQIARLECGKNESTMSAEKRGQDEDSGFSGEF